MCRLPNIQVMGIDPSTFLLQHRIQHYKQVNMKNLWKERKSISYLPLGLAYMTVHPVVVHQCLSLLVVLVSLQEGSELRRWPPLAHRVPGFWIFDEPNDVSLKFLLLGQVDVVRLAGLYRLLWHLWIVQGGRYKAGILTVSFITLRETLLKTMWAISSLMPSAKRKRSCV
jgi:hypothetical protein